MLYLHAPVCYTGILPSVSAAPISPPPPFFITLISESYFADVLMLIKLFFFFFFLQAKFIIQPYLSIQPALSETMRAILVDWLVELQENFELNHETLYLAVKLLDTYCSLVPNIRRDQIQLIGAAALFVACKFDVSICVCVHALCFSLI